MEQTTDNAALDARIRNHIHTTANRLAKCGGVPGMDAQDIEQDLFLDLWHRRHAFDPTKASFRTFADRVISNRVATLACPTIRLKAERQLVWLDQPIDDEQHTLADTLPDPAAVSDQDHGLTLDVKRFVAGLSPAMRRCCAILTAPNIREASANAGLHRSSFYENVQRLRKLAEAAGLKEYVAAPRQVGDRAGRCPA